MPGKVKHNHLNIDGAKRVAEGGDDFLRVVKLGRETVFVVIAVMTIIAGGLSWGIAAASANEGNGQNQEQKGLKKAALPSNAFASEGVKAQMVRM